MTRASAAPVRWCRGSTGSGSSATARTVGIPNGRASAGIAPRSTYLEAIGDFARWQDRVVLGCDDTGKSEFINADSIKGKIAALGVSQSNLWFVEPARLDACGPRAWTRRGVAERRRKSGRAE